jgi:hypothetical protein
MTLEIGGVLWPGLDESIRDLREEGVAKIVELVGSIVQVLCFLCF